MDEQAQPSEKSILLQKSVASSAWVEMEDEEPLIPMANLVLSAKEAPTTCQKGRGSSSSGTVTGTAKAKAASKSRAGVMGNPTLEATKQRTKTTRELKTIETAIKRATSTGTHMLSVEGPKIHGSQELSDKDPSLSLLRDRVALIQVAASQTPDPQKCKDLFDLCMQDPYLKDLQNTLLSSPDGVQTIGYINYVRNTLLDLQPSVSKVQELMESQKNAFQVLSKIASCVSTEADSWKANLAALLKAKKDEEEALRKAELKERQDEQKRAAKLAKQEQAKAEREKVKADKEAEAAAKAAEDAAGDDEVDGNAKKGRRPRVKGAELDESDPAVLRTLRSSSALAPTSVLDSVDSFVKQICLEPYLPCIARLRKSTFKKVLQVT